MSGKLLLFGFESLLNILALEGAVKPFQVELVPVGRTDYNKPMAVLAGLDTLDAAASPMQPYAGGPLGGRCCADWTISWMSCCRLSAALGPGRSV